MIQGIITMLDLFGTNAARQDPHVSWAVVFQNRPLPPCLSGARVWLNAAMSPTLTLVLAISETGRSCLLGAVYCESLAFDVGRIQSVAVEIDVVELATCNVTEEAQDVLAHLLV